MKLKNQNKVLVVGGSGYIGNIVIKYLRNKKFNVTNFDCFIYQKKKMILNKYNDYKNINIIDINKLEKNWKNYNVIIYLAGLVGDPITKKYPKLSYKINSNATKKFIEFVNKKKINHFIFVSTCSNYGLSNVTKKLTEKSKLKPISLYSKAKVDIEKYLLKNKNKLNFSFNILRFATAFGASTRMRFDLTINQFVKDIYYNKNVDVYDPDTWRPYCHVKDFASAIYKVILSSSKINSQVFNIGSNKNNFSKVQIIELIIKEMKKGKFRILKYSKDKRNYIVDFSKIKKSLNFEPRYSVKYGIKEIINFLKKKKLTYSKTQKLGNYHIYEKKFDI